MTPKSGKPLRLFVNPLPIWTDLALKSGEAMLSAAEAAIAGQRKLRVAVLPSMDAPTPKGKTAKRSNSNGRKRRAKRGRR